MRNPSGNRSCRTLAAGDNGKALEAFSTSELLEICKKAAPFFMKSDLPLDDRLLQSPDDYVQQLSGTTGMPENLCRKNMSKIQ